MKTITLRFCGHSWGEFNAGNYPFREYLHGRYDVRLAADADYLFVKETPDSIEEFCAIRTPRQVRIFFSGEAQVPDFNLFDYALGFDPLHFGDRYLRMHTLVFFRRYLQYGDLFAGKDPEKILRHKSGFCDFIYSNPKAHPSRDRFFRLLSQYQPVDALGAHLRNTGPELLRGSYEDDWRLKKVASQRGYKFSIAFENALHRGYTTEKLITPMLAGSIPIYWGNPEVGSYFNPDSFINCHVFRSFEEVVDEIRRLDTSDDLYRERLAQPWLTVEQEQAFRRFDGELQVFMQQIFDQDLPAGRRRGDGYWNTVYEDNFVACHARRSPDTPAPGGLCARLRSLCRGRWA